MLTFKYVAYYIIFYSYSVLVHSGGVHGGHYYAFIRPTLSDQWYDSRNQFSLLVLLLLLACSKDLDFVGS